MCYIHDILTYLLLMFHYVLYIDLPSINVSLCAIYWPTSYSYFIMCYILTFILSMFRYVLYIDLPPVNVPAGSKESPSNVTDFFMILSSNVTFLAVFMSLQMNAEPNTNSIAACRSFSKPINDKAVLTFPLPT